MTLGELFQQSNQRLGDHGEEPPVLSISKYQGVVPAERYHGRRVASAKLNEYKLLPSDAWVYSTIHIDEGSIARNNLGVDGVVSPMYTVMRWISPFDDPRYAELLLRSQQMLAAYADNAQGSINRRRSLSWRAFSALPVTLPPPSEQKRIVDLITAVDTAIETANTEASSAGSVLEAMLDAASCEHVATIGSVADVASGASWQKTDLRSSSTEGEPVLTIANTRPDGTVEGEPTYVSGLSPNAVRLTKASIMAVRTNGNRDRVGNVYRTPLQHVGSAVSAFQLVVEPYDDGESDYIFWAMRSPTFQRRVSDASVGSTGLSNIAVTKLKRMEIPWPDRRERRRLVSLYEAAHSALLGARATASALSELKSSLFTVLMSGEHRIPASYDLLLEEVAA